MSVKSNLDLNVLHANKNIVARNYWKSRLENLALTTYCSHHRTSSGGVDEFQEYSLVADDAVAESLQRIAASDKAKHIVLLAAAGILVQKYAGIDDICLFTPTYREDNIKHTAGSLVPVRMNRATGSHFKSFLLWVKEKFNHDLRHSNYPVQLAFQLQGATLDNRAMTGVCVDGVQSEASFDEGTPGLLFLFNTRAPLRLTIRYHTGLYQADYIALLPALYFDLLARLIASPDEKIDDIPLISAAQRNNILHHFNSPTIHSAKNKTVVGLFAERAEDLANATAVVYQQKILTYGDLDRLSNQLAHYLKEKWDVQPGDTVGVMIDKSPFLIISMLGIAKAGAVYVPADPAYPAARVQFMFSDAGVKVLLTKETFVAGIQAEAYGLEFIDNWFSSPTGSAEPIVYTVRPADLAYIIYTSGTSGNPKGVLIAHQALTNLCEWHNAFYGVTQRDAASLYASIGFDASVWEIFPYLVAGASLHIVPEKMRLDMPALSGYFEQQGITHSFLPTAIAEQFMKTGNCSLRYLLTGGDKLNTFIPRSYQLVNNYGPTENTVVTTCFLVQETADNIPIGKPISNCQVYIVDDRLQLQAVGVSGELCIGGASLAQGYLNHDALTRERFVANPFHEGERLYKTGDLARWTPDGDIEFLGRIDEQVKIRGYRIESGEIESVLRTHEHVTHAYVLALPDAAGEKQLVAYLSGGEKVPASYWKEYLRQRLPDHMIPACFVQVDHFPVTPNGKIDKNALPVPDVVTQLASATYVAPDNELEQSLVELWADILRIDKSAIGVTSSFFELGGNSLRAMMLASKIQSVLEVQISVNDIFTHKDIRSQCNLLQSSTRSGYVPLKRAEAREYYPLSIAQERLYYLAEFNKTATTFNVPLVVQIKGELDIDRMNRAFDKLARRHEALRTSIRMVDERPVQFIAREVTLSLELFAAGEERVRSIVKGFIRPFNVTQPPLFRAGLIQTAPATFYFMVDMHHLIADGTSVGVLISDFMELYHDVALSPLRVDYKDYATWLQSEAYQQRIAPQQEFWIREFSTPVTPLDIPLDFERHGPQKGEALHFCLEKEDTRRLRKLAEGEVATTSMVLTAAFSLLLQKLSGQEDIVIGMALAGREQVELERMIGMFAVVLPLRTRPAGDLTFRQFLTTLKSTFIETFDNQSYQYEELAKTLNMERNTSRNPWFDVIFLYQNYETSDFSIPGLEITPYQEQNIIAHEELNLSANEHDDQVWFRLVYSLALFKPSTAERYVRFFLTIIREVVANPNIRIADINLGEAGSGSPIAATAINDIARDKVFSDLFREQVRRTPAHTAVQYLDDSRTYSVLYNDSIKLATCLNAEGVTVNCPVVVYLPRGIGMLTALLGILQAGGTYVPVDMDYPLSRVLDILNDSEARVLITDTATLPVLKQLQPSVPSLCHIINIDELAVLGIRDCGLEVKTSTGDLAYIIYTSGTTGKPKGVMIHQLGMINHLLAKVHELDLTERDVVAQTAAPGFDISIWQFLVALLTGGKTFIIDKDKVLDPLSLSAAMQDGEVTVLETAPSLIAAILNEPPAVYATAFGRLKWMISTGEPLTVGIVAKWFSCLPDIKLLNAYGPTEASDDITHYVVERPVEGQLSVPIGRQVQNMRVYIVDRYMKLCAPGVRGEICVAGLGVGKGYWKDSVKTGRAFIPNPFAPGPDDPDYAILYRTGDLGYYQDDHHIVCLGRNDDQVKIRGFRIECGEIESKLMEHPDISLAVVLAREKAGEQYLVAWYTAESALSLQALRSFLLERLPAYMVPAFFVHLLHFPLTPNGKIDKKSLPAPAAQATEQYTPPGTVMEKELVAIWAEVLDMLPEKISVTSNFFELGGNSLKILRLRSLISKKLHRDIALQLLFQHPDIRSLTAYAFSASDVPAWKAEAVAVL